MAEGRKERAMVGGAGDEERMIKRMDAWGKCWDL